MSKATDLLFVPDQPYPLPGSVVAPDYAPGEREALITEIKTLLKEKDAVLVDLQTIADETGGCVADSLEMARFGNRHPATTLIVAGVRFMGETAKILNPEKRVLMPTLEAECSLDLGCPPEKFIPFCDAHPEYTVVVYANTCASVKARADWVVTSSIAVDVVKYLDEQGKKILWAPDRYLGTLTCCCGRPAASCMNASRQRPWKIFQKNTRMRPSWFTRNHPSRSSNWQMLLVQPRN